MTQPLESNKASAVVINNLWGHASQEHQAGTAQGFSYNPELIAAILRADIENIKQIEAGTHDPNNELSFRQYDFLIRKYGLKILENPVLFAALLIEEGL